MAAPRTMIGRLLIGILVALVVLLMAGAAGLILFRASGGQPETFVTQSFDQTAKGYDAGGASVGSAEMPATDSVTSEESAPTPRGEQDAMVIRTASLDLSVGSVDETLGKVRSAVSRHSAEITDLYVQGGADAGRPLGETESSYIEPASASVTMRVPSERLDALTTELSKLGDVRSQSGSANDVTEQHVDLKARLGNLQSEEKRLRSFFDRTDKVSDLLAVESELSRVRGEIEAMQAQIDYLERQVARATLVLTITEPGPVVRPEAGGWGFVDAITLGVQGAAAVVRVLITGLIALAPLLILAGAIVMVVRAVRHSRARRGAELASEGDGLLGSTPSTPASRADEPSDSRDDA